MHPIDDSEKLREKILDADEYNCRNHFLEDVVERQPDVDKEEVIEFLED